VVVAHNLKYRWWTADLQAKKRELRQAYLAAGRSTQDETYLSLKREYALLIKKTRRCKWQEYTSSSVTIPLQAKLLRVISQEPRPALGAMRIGDGTTYTDSVLDSLGILLDEHFPEHIRGLPTRPVKGPHMLHDIAWITPELVKKAIRLFAKGKRAGPDDITPEMLKHLPEEALTHLTSLLQMTISSGYTPICWKEANVIFLPKPAKTDYADPRSFRPITLSSFILKTLERLVLWHVNRTTLQTAPLSKAQTGLRRGHSTDLALSRLTLHLEQARSTRQTVTGLFMDIKGAFDNVPYRDLIDILRSKGLPEDIVYWYSQMLTSRCSFTQDANSGDRILMTHTRGVPQGGILSPLMWNLFFDPVLLGVQTPTNIVIGYADNLCVLQAHEAHLETILQAQMALSVMEIWSRRTGMQFCPKKSESLIFQWSRKRVTDLPQLQIYGRPITRSTSVRYLGLDITDRLNWWPHIQNKLKSAKRLLKRTNDVLGRLWGPKPTLVKWTLDAVVNPKVLYGSHVWHSLLRKQKLQDGLRRINRLGVLSMAPCRLNTPSRGLEILTGAVPLHIKAARKNILTLARFRLHHPDTPILGHTLDIYNSMRDTGLADFPMDDIPSTETPTLFQSYIDTPLPALLTDPWIHINGDEGVDPTAPVISIYTDGSKLDNQRDKKVIA